MYIHVYKKGKYQADPGGCKKSLPSVCTPQDTYQQTTCYQRLCIYKRHGLASVMYRSSCKQYY